MNTELQVKGVIQKIMQTQDVCILATIAELKPHTSFMAYICDEEYRNIYMVTHKNTKKYENLKKNPLVSVLIDTRSDTVVSREQIMALTISGRFFVLKNDTLLQSLKREFVTRHPHLEIFASNEGARFFGIKIKSIQFMKDATDAYYLRFEE